MSVNYPEPDINLPFTVETLEASNDDGIELVSDWDMANAGTGDFTSGQNATLTKESNEEGGQCLRVAYNDTDNPEAYQDVMTPGDLYNVRARQRGDGSRESHLWAGQLDADMMNWASEASNTWQEAEWEIAAIDGAEIQLRSDSTLLNPGYAEFDYVSVKRQQQRYLDISGNGNHCVRGTGYEPESFPDQINSKGIHTSSSVHFGKVIEPFSSMTTCTISLLVRDTVGDTTWFLDANNASGVIFTWLYNAATPNMRCYIGGTSSLNAATVTLLPSDNGIHHFLVYYDESETRMVMDGGAAEGTAIVPAAPNYQGQDIFFGRQYDDPGSGYRGQFLDFKFWQDWTPTEEEIKAIYEDVMSEYSAKKI